MPYRKPFQSRSKATAKSKTKSKAAAAKKSQGPAKALPVTLLSGFLGSGKTTLLQHILRSDHGLRIAVIVNDIGAINIDASLISQTIQVQKTEEKVIALQNGCICCTLRGDLLEELVRLSQLRQFDYVIVESSGISEPEQVAETFDTRLAETMSALVEQGGLDASVLGVLRILKDNGGLATFARLDTTATVIDAFTIMNDFDTEDMLSARRNDVAAEDERTVSDLMVDQIEFADVIILNKTDMVDAKTRKKVLTLINKLNHRAKVLETSYGKINPQEIVNTGLFNLERAQTGYGWLQDLHAMTQREVNGKTVFTPKPETEEYNVQNMIYTARRPFHPKRLFTLLYDKFIIQQSFPEEEEEGSDDDDEEGNSDEGVEGEMTDGEEQGEDEDEAMGDSPCSPASGKFPGARSTPRTSVSASSDEGRRRSRSKGEDATAMDEDDLVMPANDVILRNKRAHPVFGRLFRSKGEFWLASRPDAAGDWSSAGAMLTLRASRQWFCVLPASAYETGDAEIDALVKHDIASGGEWGDRRQELVFIGEALDRAALTRELDACLLNDDEWEQWCAIMRDKKTTKETKRDLLEDVFEDGFADWEVEEEEDHGHGHGHGHGHAH